MSHARGTLAALVDAVVPATPDFADERGAEHGPGGLAVDLDGTLVEAFDSLQPVHGGLLGLLGRDTAPLSRLIAALLDAAALELILRRRREDGLRSPAADFSRGPFSRLSRRDRLRAVRLLETDGVFARFGTVQYLVQALVTVTEMAYYGGLAEGADAGVGPGGDGTAGGGGPGDADGAGAAADDADLPLGWRQAGYPGPSDGYPVLLGYEVESFEEDEY